MVYFAKLLVPLLYEALTKRQFNWNGRIYCLYTRMAVEDGLLDQNQTFKPTRVDLHAGLFDDLKLHL